MPRLLLLTVALILPQQAIAAPQQAKQPPIAKLLVTEPQPNQQVSGSVGVRVKAEVPEGATAPKSVYANLGGGAWAEMTRINGNWIAEIDSTLVPNGGQVLNVITDNRKVKASVTVPVDNPLKVFFADLHSHTSYSDGTLTPALAHSYARNTAKLDVFCLTDHLESVNDAEWLDTREVAFDANEDGTFVVIPGLEWTKKWGHLNIYDPKTRHWPANPQAFYKAAADAGVMTKFNHPGDGSKSHAGLAYSKIGDRTVQLMEVRQDKEQIAFIRALNNGWHLAPEGSDDTHSPNWGNVRSWTGILAPGLSKQNVLDALAKRHVYSTLDRNCELTFQINGATMGEIISELVTKLKVRVVVDDADISDVTAKIELYEDGQVIATHEPDAAECWWEPACSPEPGKHYYFAKVTQADGNLLWSAPIWVTVVER